MRKMIEYKRILNWDYDPKRDIIFIFSMDKYDYHESINLKNMTVDLNFEGKAVALEIFDSTQSLEVEPESLICPLDFLIEISGKKDRCLYVNASFKLPSQRGLIHRTLQEEKVIEQKFIIRNILRPTHSNK